MKIFTNILRVIFTVLLTLVIIPIELATMSIFAVNHAVSPETLSKTIKEITFAVIETELNESNRNQTAEICSTNYLSTTEHTNDYASEMERLINDIAQKLNADYNKETGIFTFGANVTIDVSSTGILPFIEQKFSEEDIYNILYSSEISMFLSDYAANVINAFFTGENTIRKLNEDECINIVVSTIDAINAVTEVSIPEEVKQNFINEVKKNAPSIVTVINDSLPDVKEIKEAIAIDSDIDLDQLDIMFDAISCVFGNTILIAMCVIIAILGIILIAIHLKSKFGILWLSAINILNGLLFLSINTIFNSDLISEIISSATDSISEQKLLNGIFNIVSALIKSLNIVGAVVLGIGVALLILYIVLKVISTPKYYERDTESI